ncbi:MAG: exodeoxyribonuclease 7 small subunit [Pseudomonadota bacterium]|jgi:exodeoxyribonuclease VII small subunit
MSKAKKNRGFQFENSLKELEKIAEQLERGNSTLEESLEQFSRGISLLKDCRLALEQGQQKVHILTSSAADDINQKNELLPFKINEELTQ